MQIEWLCTETKAAVRVEGKLTEWFDIVNGLRQGCLLSPILFNAYIDHALKIALKGYGGNVRIKFRIPDGGIARGDLCKGMEREIELLYVNNHYMRDAKITEWSNIEFRESNAGVEFDYKCQDQNTCLQAVIERAS